MRLDLYQAETARLAREQSAMLGEARLKLQAGQLLSRLEQGGVLHALQVLIENVIGIRNRIVHDYMNIDMGVILDLVSNERYRFIVDFLSSPIKPEPSEDEYGF